MLFRPKYYITGDESHLNYNTVNHDNLIRMDISPKLNGANSKQPKEHNNNSNILTLKIVAVNKDKKKKQCSRHQSKPNTLNLQHEG